MSEHRLKTVQPYFNDVLNGRKTFEVRKNDRDFKVGDTLELEEYDPAGVGYTGQAIIREVTYVLDSTEYCKPGYVVLGINNPTDARRAALTASIPLDRLEAICAAEREGRCVVLPCKDWLDIVFGSQEAFWTSDYGVVMELRVHNDHRFEWYGGPETLVLIARDEFGDYEEIDPCDIGKTVFLTREAAEAALQEAKG